MRKLNYDGHIISYKKRSFVNIHVCTIDHVRTSYEYILWFLLFSVCVRTTYNTNTRVIFYLKRNLNIVKFLT